MLHNVGDRVHGTALAFAGGFILAVAFMELIRRGIEISAQLSVAVTLAGLVAGVGVRALITHWVAQVGTKGAEPRDDTLSDVDLRNSNTNGDSSNGDVGLSQSRGNPAAQESKGSGSEVQRGWNGGVGSNQGGGGSRQARQIAISLAMVNLLEGLSVGIGFAVNGQLGILLGGVMVFENFTEVLSVTTEISRGEKRSWVVWRY